MNDRPAILPQDALERSRHNRVLAYNDDGTPRYRASDTAEGRVEIARLEAEGEVSALDALAGRLDVLEAARAIDSGVILHAVGVILGEHAREFDKKFAKLRQEMAEPPAPPPEASTEAVDALTVRLAKLESDVATLTASVASLTEAVNSVLPPVPLSAPKPQARRKRAAKT